MKRKLLVAVDGSLHARHALVYSASLMTRGEDLFCSLLHVQPVISQYLLEEARTNPRVNSAIKNAIERNTFHSKEILEQSKELMLRQGVNEARLETISQTRIMGLSKDIIEYARKNLFDAIVLGRRGLSKLQEVFMGSTSAKLADHSGGIPVWIVDGEARPHRFLVAVDDVASAFQIVDYIALVCRNMEDLSLTFFHVPQKTDDFEGVACLSGTSEIDAVINQKEQQVSDQFWPEATARLNSAGIENDQLELLIPTKTAQIGKMIIDAAKDRNIDTIILGRRGSSKAFYFGSVSRFVTERLFERAVWIIG